MRPVASVCVSICDACNFLKLWSRKFIVAAVVYVKNRHISLIYHREDRDRGVICVICIP